MITATAKSLFYSKFPFIKNNLKHEYEYHLTLPDEPTWHDIFLEISRCIKKDKRINTAHLPMYELNMELLGREQIKVMSNGKFLAQTARIVLPKGNPNPRKDAYLLANQRNEETKPVIMKCDECKGTGHAYHKDLEKCPVCDGEGFIIWRLTNRVGRAFNNRLIIDVDGHDETNMKFMLAHAETISVILFE